jgi:hypothetical protein
MVTIEKFQNIEAVAPGSTLVDAYRSPHGLFACQNGSDLTRCGCCAEDEIIAVARAIKAVNPNVMTAAYLNSQISYGWYRSSRELAANSSWWLTTHDGPKGSTWKTYDLSVAAAAHSWQQAALNLTTTGVIDTVFADGCMKLEGGPHGKEVLAAKYAMLRQLQTQVPGPIICGTSDGTFLPGVNATQAEGWGVDTARFTTQILALMKAAREGIVYQAHGRAVCGQAGERPSCCVNPPCNCTTVHPNYNDTAAQTELAAFLVAAGKYSYFVCGSWEDTLSDSSTSSWLPVYDLPLGEPLGNAVKKGAVWYRSFASGTNVTFDTKHNKGAVHWARPT